MGGKASKGTSAYGAVPHGRRLQSSLPSDDDKPQTTTWGEQRETQTLLEPPVQSRHIHKQKDVVPHTTILSMADR